jgi:hypothetical protein
VKFTKNEYLLDVLALLVFGMIIPISRNTKAATACQDSTVSVARLSPGAQMKIQEVRCWYPILKKASSSRVDVLRRMLMDPAFIAPIQEM